ncbi:MAG: hypothetical protein ACI977_000057 [Candidatus Nanohaloarchaea archaeon]
MSSHEAATGGFNNLLQIMGEQGFFSGLLPFVVTYVLFFLTLKRIPLFKENEDDNRFAAILSVVFAFFVAQFLVSNPVYQQFFVEYLGTIALTVVGLLGLLVVLAFIGLDVGTKDDPGKGIYGIILTGIVILAFFITGGGQLFIPDNINNQAIQQMISYVVDSGLIWILVVAGIIYWTLSDPGEGSGPKLSDLFQPVGGE